jgi:hypothetical protein
LADCAHGRGVGYESNALYFTWKERTQGLRSASRVDGLLTQPELVLDRLAKTRSVWSGADIEREVRRA